MPCNHAVVVSCGLCIIIRRVTGVTGLPSSGQAGTPRCRCGVEASSTAEETHVVSGEYLRFTFGQLISCSSSQEPEERHVPRLW